MALSTMTVFDAMLKETYKAPMTDALPKKVDLYDEFTKSTDEWQGNKVINPVRLTSNKAHGARAEGGTMPNAGSQGTEEHQITAKYNYQIINFSRQVMKASRNNTGAFAKASAFEMKMGLKDLTKQIDRQLYGDGTGTVATIKSGTSSATQTVYYAGAVTTEENEPGTRYLQAGDELCIGTTTELGTSGAPAYETISSITNAYTIVLAGSVTTVTNDLVVFGHSAATAGANNNYNHEIEGLNAACITSGTYQNIDNAAFKANVYGNSDVVRTLSGDIMQQVIDGIDRNGNGNCDLIIADISLRRKFLDEVRSDKRFASPANMDAGYTKDLWFNGIKVRFTRNCPYNQIFFLDRGTWKLYEMGPIEFMNEDGSVLHRGTTDAFEARLEYYANLSCLDPISNGKLEDITAALATS